jgi:adenosylcobinamide kinase/adenosylcobinamide-phosphate guanylyltransferase
MLTFILGGARSGKSRLAQGLAMNAGRVVYVATARAAADHEMLARIARHRRDRPSDWKTVEESLDLAGAVDKAVSDADTILVDCLTIWLSNLFWQYREGAPEQIEAAWQSNLERIANSSRRSHVIVVSNEVGSGTVPEASLTRAFRDSQGLLNQYAAELADQVILTVAGLPLYLKALDAR